MQLDKSVISSDFYDVILSPAARKYWNYRLNQKVHWIKMLFSFLNPVLFVWPSKERITNYLDHVKTCCECECE